MRNFTTAESIKYPLKIKIYARPRKADARFALFFRRAPQNCIPVNALAVFAAPRRYTPFLVFLITTSGVVTPHARNYAICWPSSHTEYRLDRVTGGGSCDYV
ncbi:hypothetical protein AD14_0515 [Escherichia coli 3-073-06_S4_C2]|nr:hypothetical protein AD14_0515 [Escherichia coli 3-073-06_S4_C2]